MKNHRFCFCGMLNPLLIQTSKGIIKSEATFTKRKNLIILNILTTNNQTTKYWHYIPSKKGKSR